MNLQSFNENIILDFNVEEHTYHHEGVQFLSASTFVKKYEQDFDKERISLAMSQSCNVPQADILQMWEDNGKSASTFGTAMHLVLENYFKNEKTGCMVQGAKGKEYNAAMPKHPVLRNLILTAKEITPDIESVQEACVSLKKDKICGLIDNLLIVDSKKKICRVTDYKITADILVHAQSNKLDAPFTYLGDTKVAKYIVQLGFYSYLLQSSGWKVQGIDILNWDGAWTVHSLEGENLMKVILLVGTEISKGVMKSDMTLEDMIKEHDSQ